MAKTAKSVEERSLRILYIEDREDTLTSWLRVLRDLYSPESVGARSCEAAREILEGGFLPHLVFHDREILFADSDQVASPLAGNRLYYFMNELELPIVVLSGDNAADQEPYLSMPPLLWLPKPTTEQKFRQGVKAYFDRLQSGDRGGASTS